jgi:hypothetical protein
MSSSFGEFKRFKSPDIRLISAYTIQARRRTLGSANQKLIHFIRNKKEVPRQWIELIIVLIHVKGDNIDCSNHRGIALFRTLSNILPYNVIIYIDRRNYW